MGWKNTLAADPTDQGTTWMGKQDWQKLFHPISHDGLSLGRGGEVASTCIHVDHASTAIDPNREIRVAFEQLSVHSAAK